MVDLVGSGDHGRHGVLVAWRDNCEERESSQGQVVHATGHAALIIAVWVQTGKGRSKEGGVEGQEGTYSIKNRLHNHVLS